MRFAFIAKHRGIWQIRQKCEMLGVSRAGFYEWLHRPPSPRTQRNELLIVQIRRSYQISNSTYGSPRVQRDLCYWGHVRNHKRVAWLMRPAGIKAHHKRRRLPTDTGTRPESSIAPNLLDRQFEAAAPNERWVADFPTCGAARVGCTLRWSWICTRGGLLVGP